MGAEIVNPIGCSDCHDPETMNLHISRPALIEAFQRQGKDITKATPQEMRSLVCAQCHVEYYFKGDGKYLTFPWDKGFTVEDMEAYYDEAGFYDYIHKLSRTPILKAQHPDYEIAQMGIHGQHCVITFMNVNAKRMKSVTVWSRSWQKRISKLNMPGIMGRQKSK